jgi:iron(III) transport system substrate-binding protein
MSFMKKGGFIMTRFWSTNLQDVGAARFARRLTMAAIVLAGGILAAGAAQAEDWNAVEKASKGQERVLVYSTLRPDNWKPIQEALKARYSWIKLEPLRMGSHNEALERYRAESASGTRSADIVIASLPEEWPRMSAQKELVDFDPADLKKLPKFAKPGAGYFTLSVEPQVLVYNKLLLPAAMQPKGFTDLTDKIAKNPALFKGKV